MPIKVVVAVAEAGFASQVQLLLFASGIDRRSKFIQRRSIWQQ